MTTRLDEFAWHALQDEAALLGVSSEELMTFALLYYLADVDNGRVSRKRRAVRADAGKTSELQARLAERYGARPGRGSLLELDPPPGEPNVEGAEPASDALRWVRGE